MEIFNGSEKEVIMEVELQLLQIGVGAFNIDKNIKNFTRGRICFRKPYIVSISMSPPDPGGIACLYRHPPHVESP
mgnify:CR=1